MNKTELIESIAAKAGLTKSDAKKAFEASLESVKEALVKGDKVQLIGFGTFAVSERLLVRVSTHHPAPRYRLPQRRLLSSRRVQSLLMK